MNEAHPIRARVRSASLFIYIVVFYWKTAAEATLIKKYVSYKSLSN
jgi:hypothetical protein